MHLSVCAQTTNHQVGVGSPGPLGSLGLSKNDLFSHGGWLTRPEIVFRRLRCETPKIDVSIYYIFIMHSLRRFIYTYIYIIIINESP